MRILALTKHLSGVDYHRIILPLSFFPFDKGDGFMIVDNTKSISREMFLETDIVLFTRDCPFDLDTILDLRNDIGFKIVVDIDDYWYLPSEHPLINDWLNNCTSLNISRSIRHADLVTTTHEHLKKRIESINPNVAVVSNALPYGKLQFHAGVNKGDNIMYSCTITHLPDIKYLGGFFDMCKNDPEIQRYKLCVAGESQKNPVMKSWWSRIEFEASRYGNYKMWPHLSIDHYMAHYTMAKIAIAPLVNNDFNKCKSFLKALEAGCKNIPLLASAIHPYTEMPVIHCKTQKDWYNNLKQLIKRPELMEEKGKLLGDYVRREYDLEKINHIRKDLYYHCVTS